MSQKVVFHPTEINPDFVKKARLGSLEEYKKKYTYSIENPEEFWAREAEEHITWFRKWDKVLEHDFANAKIKWFLGGKLNLSYNALDRHLSTFRKNKAAIIWEGDFPDESRTITYQQLYREVCRLANVLKKHGVKKGDRVTIYLPMIPELAVAVLACCRIGAIHSVVFGGFSPDALKDRILDARSSFLITADGGFRGGKIIPLKQNADQALKSCPEVRRVLVVKRTGHDVASWVEGRDMWYHHEMKKEDIQDECPPEEMDAEDPLFILYTSGSTGKPKGVLHTTGGYGVYTAMTHKYVFDIRDEDTYWCTADIGWVTGHSYIVYGPLINGATSLMFEGVPTFPDVDRFWAICEKYSVNIFYTAPTAIRALMRYGEEPVRKHKLDSLRLLGSVGEPINPEAWLWYFRTVGNSRCPVVDTWWQTETGGILISPLPGAIPQKPGSATLPFFGVQPAIVDGEGRELSGPCEGNLCLKFPWPSIMRGVYGDEKRFYDTYFSTFKGYYFTGDGCRRDEDGYYWITGRVDDVINVAGHRLGTAEIESALVLHPKVAEAAVVGYPHEIKGQGIYAFVTLKAHVEPSESLKAELVEQVARELSPIAKPDIIQFAAALPKTRSGKIMRRILRKIASGDIENLGDTTTLAEPAVVETLVRERVKV
ncbi:MAG: acetate--CoA ligase [Leptospiraceae bacterium]|nr:acetate--CoA ligase [Leptospiraceae bacterium]MDW8306795.1 acetate--CoA ligase [Leptospiraceae bacterium]